MGKRIQAQTFLDRANAEKAARTLFKYLADV